MVTNVGASPQLDATQLAVLQQLAHTAASVPSVSQTLPLPDPVNVQKFPSSSGVSGSSHSPPSSHRDEPHNMAKKEQRYNRFHSPENEIGLNPHFDPDNIRGKYRGGLRSRGRGDHLTHKWDNRDRDSYRTSERERSPPRRGGGGRSRSRSPPSRYGGRRSSRFSQRTRLASPSQRQESLQGSTSSRTENDSGKDEFGRDIRPQSPHSKSPSVARETSLPAPISPTTIIKPRVESRSSLAVTTNLDQKSVSPLVTADDAASKPSAPLVSNTVPYSGLGMDNFDLSTFDYTSPASWEALGKMWQVTNGYLPSTEQLIQFVISCGTGQMSFPELSNGNQEQSAGFTNQSWGEEQLSGGGFPYGNGRNMHQGSDILLVTQTTDAIVLGGDDTNGPKNTSISSGQKPTPTLQESQISGSSSGRMQKVGDKWVFVRGSNMDVS
jgi:protein NRD1